MECIRQAREKFGLEEKSFEKSKLAKVDKETGIIHFFPAKKICQNFSQIIKSKEKFSFSGTEIMEIVKKYTTHDSWYCSKINLLLAADSVDLKDHADYIRKLRWCIRKLAIEYPIKESKCYRGYDCSKEEFDAYKIGENFYIPSFLSSSKNPKKFYQASNHNTIMIINLDYRPNNAFLVTGKFSIYAEQEEEVLFSCYSKFRVKKKSINKNFNNKNYEFFIEMEHINEVDSDEDNLRNFMCYSFFFK